MLRCEEGRTLEVIDFRGAAKLSDPTAMVAELMAKAGGPGTPVRREGDVIVVGDDEHVTTYAKLVTLPGGMLVVAICGIDAGRTVPRAWCKDVIAALGKQGLPGGELGRETRAEVAGRALEVPDGCQTMPGDRIACPGGGVLWFLEATSETKVPLFMKGLLASQVSSGFEVADERLPCTLMGAKKTCILLTLREGRGAEKRKVVGVTTLPEGHVVLSCLTDRPGSLTPAPCNQVISVP